MTFDFKTLVVALRTYSVQALVALTAFSTLLATNPALAEMLPQWVIVSVPVVLGVLGWVGRVLPQPEAKAALEQAQSAAVAKE